MNKLRTVPPALLAAVLLAGCSGTGDDATVAQPASQKQAAEAEPAYRYANAEPGSYVGLDGGRARLLPFATEEELVAHADLVVVGTVVSEEYNQPYGPEDLRLQTRNMVIEVEGVIAGSPAGGLQRVQLLDEPGREVASGKPVITEGEVRVEVGDRGVFTLVKFPNKDAYQLRIAQGALLLGNGQVIDTPRGNGLVRRFEAMTEAQAIQTLKAAKP